MVLVWNAPTQVCIVLCNMCCYCAFCCLQKLYIRKPGLTLNAAKLVTNEEKNRYSDILPCKSLSAVLF